MSEYRLEPRLAVGTTAPASLTIASITLTEQPGWALASLAARKDQGAALAQTLASLLPTLPGPVNSISTPTCEALWTGPDQWMLLSPLKSDMDLDMDLERQVKQLAGEMASVTDQTDAWVVFEISGEGISALMERLVNIDLKTKPTGFTTRTIIEHIGVILHCRKAGERFRLLAPRSLAKNLAHVLETAAKSLAACATISDD